MELDLIGKKIVGTRSSPLTSHFFLSLSVQKDNLVKMLNRTCHLTTSIHCFSQWGGRHLLYHFHSLCTYWEPFNFSPGKLVPRGFWERETNAVQWKPWSSTANGGNWYNLWSRLREHGPFNRATLGKVSFLVLWHIWTNLAANIAVNRWNVDHVYAVCDHVGLKYLTGKLRDRSLFM